MSTKNTVADLHAKKRAVLPALFDFYELIGYYVSLQTSLLQSNTAIHTIAGQQIHFRYAKVTPQAH
jgi:hypothetical protein